MITLPVPMPLEDPDHVCTACDRGEHHYCGGRRGCRCARCNGTQWHPKATSPLSVACPVGGCDAAVGEPCTGMRDGTAHWRRRELAGGA